MTRKILLVFFLLAAAIKPFAQKLTIRHFGLADGDATLFIFEGLTKLNAKFQDTFTILIDADRDYVYEQLISGVEDVLKAKGYKQLDVALVSHMHIDHYGSMVNTLKQLISDGFGVGYVIDRLQLSTPNVDLSGAAVDSCYDYINTPSLSVAAAAYKTYMTTESSKGTFKWVSVPVGQDLFVGNLQPYASMTVVAVNGVTRNANGDPFIFIPKQSGDTYKAKSQNDLSYCFLLNFGAFNYFTGGDLGGDASKYADGETWVANYIAAVEKPTAGFHTCAFKVNHHGSASSSNGTFLATLNPTLAVFSAALRSYSGTSLPTETAVNAVKSVSSSIFYTFDPDDWSKSVNNWQLAYLEDISLEVPYVIAAFGNKVPMTVNTYRRDKTTRVLDGTTNNYAPECKQTHNLFTKIPGPSSTMTMKFAPVKKSVRRAKKQLRNH